MDERYYIQPPKERETEPEFKIDWHTPKYQFLYEEDGMETWESLGTGNDGRDYSAISYFTNDEFIERTDVSPL